MTTVSSCSIEEISSFTLFDKEMEASSPKIKELVGKVNAIWARAYDLSIGNGIRVFNVVRSAIGGVLRDAFFFPLKCSLLMSIPFIREQMKLEEQYCKDFWDVKKPLDPNFKDQAKVRAEFGVPNDRAISIDLGDGRVVQITCRIMQSKSYVEGEPCYNFIHIPGIQTTIANDIGGIYPYLASFLNSRETLVKEDGSTLPGRFIIVSENNTSMTDAKGVKRIYKSNTLDEAGFVLAETLKALVTEFGEFDQIVAHSLGCIVFSSSLKYLSEAEQLPKRLCLDRGPISIWEISKKYFFGLGRFLYPLVKLTDWSLNIEQQVVDLCQKRLDLGKKLPSILIAGVERDSHFSDSANLCLGKKIRALQERGLLNVLFFNPPLQVFHEHANHSLRADFLNPRYLMERSDFGFMDIHENFAEAIIRHSLETPEELNEEVEEIVS